MNRRELLLAAAGIAVQAVAATPRKPTALLLHRLFESHVTGQHHPESPARMKAIEEALGAVQDKCLLIEPRDATAAELAACHDKAYLELARREIESDRGRLSTGDTTVGRESWQVAVQAAGGVMAAVDAVVSARAANAFCALRPPGHHAGPARGMGFCILNNIALAVRYARDKHGIGKALIVDWDDRAGRGPATPSAYARERLKEALDAEEQVERDFGGWCVMVEITKRISHCLRECLYQ